MGAMGKRQKMRRGTASGGRVGVVGLLIAMLLTLAGWQEARVDAISVVEFSTVGTMSGGGPGAAATPRGIVYGADSNIWFTERDANRIGKVTRTGVVTLYDIPTANSQPLSIIAGPDGNLWFNEYAGNKIGRITPAGVITEFAPPATVAVVDSTNPGAPAQAVQEIFGLRFVGNTIWFTRNSNTFGMTGANIGKFVPTTEQWTLYQQPTAQADIYDLAFAGGFIYFTEVDAQFFPTGTPQMQNIIGKFNPNDAVPVITEFSAKTTVAGTVPIGQNPTPGRMTIGPDNNIWFAAYFEASVYKLDVSTNAITGYCVGPGGACSAPNHDPFDVVTGPDNNLWVTIAGDPTQASGANVGSEVVSMTAAGVVTRYTVPTANSKPFQIAASNDSIWFSERATGVNKVGRVILDVPAPTTTYANPTFTGLPGSDPDGAGPATGLAFDAFTTVQGAIDAVAVGGTVNVQAGTYAELLTVSKALTLTGGIANPTVTAPGSATNAAVVTVAASNVTVNGLNIAVNRPNATAGIAGGATAQVNFNNATITNNTVTVTGTGGTFANRFFGTTPLGIALLDNGDIPTVTITGNTVAAGDSGTSFFGRGIWLRSLKATITGNTVTASIQDILEQFASGGPTLIQMNTLRGGGLDITEPNTDVTVNNNTFTPISNAFDQTLLVKNNNTGAVVNVTNNTLTGFGKVGILAGNSKNTTVTGNTLTPAATLPVGTTSATGILISSRAPGTNPAGLYEVNVTVRGNTLNGGVVSTTGVLLQNGNTVLPAAYAVMLGGAGGGQANIFNANLTTYIRLSNVTGQEVAADVDASGNTFGGVAPIGATVAQLTAIEDKVLHFLDYGTPAGYVALNPNNIVITRNTGNTVAARGITKIAAGGTVNLAAGDYTEQLTINKSLALVGAGQGNTSILAGNMPLPPVTIGSGATTTTVNPIVFVTGGSTTASVTNLTVNGLLTGGPAPAPLKNRAARTGSNTGGGRGPNVVTNGCSDDFYGVFVGGGATFNISNAAVRNIRNTDSTLYGCQTGYAVNYGYASYGEVGKGSLNNVQVTGYQKGGLFLDGPMTQVSVIGSTFTAAPEVLGSTAPNGVVISEAKVPMFTGNTISGNKCNLPAPACGPDTANNSQSGGLVIFAAGNLTIGPGNTFSDNDAGLILADAMPNTTTLTVTGNTFTNDRYQAVALYGGTTTLSNNTITGPGLSAIFLDTPTGTTTYQNNTITGYMNSAAAQPTLTNASPNTANAGQTVTFSLTGTNFVPGATAKVGNTTCQNTNVPTSASMTCSFVAPNTGGMFNVVLTNPDGKIVTITNGFTITVQMLTVTSASPDAVKIAGGDLVTIIGTNFQPGTSVHMDGRPVSATFVSTTQLVFASPAHAAGVVTVVVTGPNGQTAMTNLRYGTINVAPTVPRPMGVPVVPPMPPVAMPPVRVVPTPPSGGPPTATSLPAPQLR